MSSAYESIFPVNQDDQNPADMLMDVVDGGRGVDSYGHYRQWLVERKFYSLYFIGAYVFFVFAGQAFMKNRKPLPLSTAFLVWNVVLALFSMAGTINIFPEFVGTLAKNGLFLSYCQTTDQFYSGHTGYWVYLFHVSKLFELGDTLFLIGRKRPVIFLHWYHHVTVLGYTWITYDINQGPSRWGILMNYFIHSIMYSYYALKSARLRCPKFLAPLITTLQISQFVVGASLCFHSFYHNVQMGAPVCDMSFWVTVASTGIYFTYFLLFAHFFYRSYVDKTSLTNKLIDRRKLNNGASSMTEMMMNGATNGVHNMSNGSAMMNGKKQD